MIPQLQDSTLIALEKARQRANNSNLSAYLHYIYANTRDDSGLRKYVAFVCASTYQGSIGNPTNYPQEALVDIINVMRAQSRGVPDLRLRIDKKLAELFEDMYCL